MQKAPDPKHPKDQDKMRRPNLSFLGIQESEDSNLNVFNTIIEESAVT